MNNDVKNIKYHELKRFEYNTQPKVSVIIPCYNVEKYIDRCLNSLIHQTLKNIEIICIDDKSTDFTLKKLLKYAKQDPRIIVIPQKKNSGAAIARNIGIEHTRGRYIGFVDADDYVDKDFYEKLYITAIKNKAQIAKGNAKILDVDFTKRYDDLQMQRIHLYGKWRFMYQWWTGLYSAKMLKSKHIRFPKDIICGQDIVFLTECVYYTNKIALCNDTFYHYLRRPDSLDSVILSPEKINSKIKAIQNIANFYNRVEIPEKEYLYCYHQRWVLLKSFIDKTVDLECKKRIAQACIDMLNTSKKPEDLITFHLKYDATSQRYINELKKSDTEGFLKKILPQTPNLNIKNTTEKTEFIFLFFCFIPLIKLYKKEENLILKFLGIQLLKIKKNKNVQLIYLLYIPLLKVRKK